jgi:hypothetical protein
VHAAKSLAIRPAVTATTGGIGNTPVSMLEDVVATLLSIIAIIIPLLIGIALVILTVWVIRRIWRHDRKSLPA